jgi:hypothetical protein
MKPRISFIETTDLIVSENTEKLLVSKLPQLVHGHITPKTGLCTPPNIPSVIRRHELVEITLAQH